jgi:hypothetical protein
MPEKRNISSPNLSPGTPVWDTEPTRTIYRRDRFSFLRGISSKLQNVRRRFFSEAASSTPVKTIFRVLAHGSKHVVDDLPPPYPGESPEYPKLENLPAKVLLQIQSYLPRESRAALSMANRHMLAVCGNGVARIKYRGEWKAFLELLDRDLSFLVFCRPCGSIHAPDEKQCVYPRIWSGWPPFGAVHAIMRNYRAGRDYRELLMQYTRHKRRTCLVLGPTLMLSCLKVEHDAGHLISESEVFWIPTVARDTSPRTLFLFGKAVYDNRGICPHTSFSLEYPFLCPDMRSFGQQPIFLKHGDGRATETIPLPTGTNKGFLRIGSGQFSDLPKFTPSSLLIDEALRCGLFHETGCSCPGSSAWGVVKSCSKCYTDFCLSKQDLSGGTQGRVLVFTVWRDLGTGESRDDPIWLSHWICRTANTPANAPTNTPRPSSGAWQCRRSERLRREGGRRVYAATTGRMHARELSNPQVLRDPSC